MLNEELPKKKDKLYVWRISSCANLQYITHHEDEERKSNPNNEEEVEEVKQSSVKDNQERFSEIDKVTLDNAQTHIKVIQPSISNKFI